MTGRSTRGRSTASTSSERTRTTRRSPPQCFTGNRNATADAPKCLTDSICRSDTPAEEEQAESQRPRVEQRPRTPPCVRNLARGGAPRHARRCGTARLPRRGLHLVESASAATDQPSSSESPKVVGRKKPAAVSRRWQPAHRISPRVNVPVLATPARAWLTPAR